MSQFTVSANQLRAAMLFTSKDKSRPTLQCVHLYRRDDGRAFLEATDSYKMIVIDITENDQLTPKEDKEPCSILFYASDCKNALPSGRQSKTEKPLVSIKTETKSFASLTALQPQSLCGTCTMVHIQDYQYPSTEKCLKDAIYKDEPEQHLFNSEFVETCCKAAKQLGKDYLGTVMLATPLNKTWEVRFALGTLAQMITMPLMHTNGEEKLILKHCITE